MTERIRVPEGKKKIVLADVSQAADVAARDAADAKLTNEKHVTGSLLSGERWKQIGRNIWKHNLAREYYRQKEIGTAKSAITESGNIYVEEGLDKTKHDAALQAVVQQFSSEAVDDVIHTEVGEKRTKADGLLKDEIFSHIYDFAKNAPSPEGASADLYKMHEANFRQAVLTAARERGGDSLDQGTMFADNLLEMAKDVRANIAHYSGAAGLDKDYEVIVGRARMGARTEANYNKTDRLLELMQSNKFTAAIASPLVVGALAAAATIAGKAALSRTAAWLTFGVAGVAAGAFAYKQESKRFKEERRQHSREKAVGKEFTTETDSRRAEMDKYSYETKSSSELKQALETAVGGNDPSEIRGVLAQIEARIRLSDRQNIDLVSYSDVSQVGQERLVLDIARAQAKTMLKNGHGITAEALEADVELTMGDLTKEDGDIQSKDKMFNSMRQKRAWKMAAIGTVVGVGAGLVAEEAYAAMSTNRAGLIESAWGGSGDKMTFAKSLATYLSGDLSAAPPSLAGGATLTAIAPIASAPLPMHTIAIGGGNVTMPQSYSLFQSSSGYALLDSSGRTVASGLRFDPNGVLDNTSKQVLASAGVQADSTVHSYNTVTTGTVRPIDYTARNANMVDINRKFGWQDWGTRHPDFDELGLQGGGREGAKIVTGDDGRKYYEFSMRGMKREGLARLRGGANFNLLLTVSEDTQARGYEFKFDSAGKARVLADSEAGRLLFKEDAVKGSKTPRALYLGKFAEVAEYKTMRNGNTGQRIWATDVGPGKINAITTEIPGIRREGMTTLRILPPAESAARPDALVPPADKTSRPIAGIEAPWFIPLTSRRPLERASGNRTPGSFAGEGVTPFAAPIYYGLFEPDALVREMQQGNEAFTPDTYVRNEDGTWTHPDGSPIVRDTAEERRIVEAYLSRQEPNYLDELNRLNTPLTPMHEKCRVAFTIPARFEEQHLGNLLDQYARQVDADGNTIDPDLFEVNIIINRRNDEQPDKSVAVIDQWKTNNPRYHVNAIDVTFPQPQANVGTARKYITDLTLTRSTSRASIDRPLYIQVEDADIVSIDQRTTSQLIAQFDAKPQLDILRGVQDRQPEVMQENDRLFFSRRLWDVYEVLMRGVKYRPEIAKGSSSFVWNRVISGGWNTAMTAKALAQVGGYKPALVGEDMRIGQEVSLLRGRRGPDGNIAINSRTAETSGLRANSSPRRFLWAMARSLAPYADFENQALKTMTLQEMLDDPRVAKFARIDDTQLNDYRGEINNIVRFTREQTQNNEEIVREVTKRLLNFMSLEEGRDYTLRLEDENPVELLPAGLTRIKQGLELYRTSERWKIGYKRQTATIAN